MAIVRTPIVDDDGSGRVGTVLNDAWKQEFYDQIDAALAAFTALTSSGVWTPTDASGAGLSLTVAHARYYKIDDLVIATAHITYPSTANGSSAAIGGFPFTSLFGQVYGAIINYGNQGSGFYLLMNSSATTANFFAFHGGALANSAFSGRDVRISMLYQAV